MRRLQSLQRRQLHRHLQRLALLGLMLALAGCMSGCAVNSSAPPVTTNLGPFEVIKFSCRDTDKTRAAIVAHNIAYLSLQQQKLVEIKDTCPRQTPKPAPKPATS